MAELNEDNLSEVHCVYCGRFLALADIIEGIVKRKCKCKQWTVLSHWSQGLDKVELSEVHCVSCGRFLALANIIEGVVKMKCTESKCKQWTVLSHWSQGLDKMAQMEYSNDVKAK